MLHGYIEPNIKQISKAATKRKTNIEPEEENSNVIKDFSIAELTTTAKENNSDIVELLKSHIILEEVSL